MWGGMGCILKVRRSPWQQDAGGAGWMGWGWEWQEGGKQQRDVLCEGEAHDGGKEGRSLSLNIPYWCKEWRRGGQRNWLASQRNPELPTSLPTCFVWLVLLQPEASGWGSLYPTTEGHPELRSLSTHTACLLPTGVHGNKAHCL